jgi:hypothetical protein
MRALPSIGRPLTTRFFGKSGKTVKTMPRPCSLLRLCLLAVLTGDCGQIMPTPSLAAAETNAVTTNQTTGNADPAIPNAETILSRAINTMDSWDSFSARIHLSGNLFGEPFVGSGVYFEEAPTRLRHLRLELNIQMRDQPATLLQVCDGQGFWTFRQQGEQRSLTRVDVARVVQLAAGPPGSAAPGALPGWPGLGGFPRLLRALGTAFHFDTIEPGNLQQVADGDQQSHVPVWRIQGTWRPARLAQLVPDQKKNLDAGKPIDWAKMPGQLPSHAAVFVGQADLIPYRIEYRRVEKKRVFLAFAPPTTVALALQLSDVSLNAPLDPACFVQHIGDMGSNDGTSDFLHATGMQ